MFCRSNNRGFTLIEIMVAIVLFLIGAISVARLQTWGTRGTTFGREALVATTAAQTLMEQLKEQATLGNFNGVLAGGGPSPVTSNPVMTWATIKAGTQQTNGTSPTVPGMTIQWAVSNTGGSAATTPPTQYTTVTVTVQWAQNTRQYQTQTIISQLQYY